MILVTQIDSTAEVILWCHLYGQVSSDCWDAETFHTICKPWQHRLFRQWWRSRVLSTYRWLFNADALYLTHKPNLSMSKFKFLSPPVFLQNKARRDDFCPRNLKNMHMVVDKLMAHSHLKYKGAKLQQISLYVNVLCVSSNECQ